MTRDTEVTVRVQHVTLTIRREDVDRALEFWHLLGFEDAAVPPRLHRQTVWVEAGPAEARTQIHLLFDEGAPSGFGELDGDHVAVFVSDFDATVERLRRAGFPMRQGNKYWGADRVFVGHPSGHRVELMAAPPPAEFPEDSTA